MVIGIIIVAVADLLVGISAYIVRRWEQTHSGQRLAFGTVLLCFLAGLGVQIVGGFPLMAATAGDRTAAGIGGAIFILLGAAPVILYVLELSEAFSHSASDLLLGMHSGRPVPSGFSKARSLANAGDIDGAIRQYRAYFNEDPKEARPLIEAANLLANEQRFAEASEILKEVVGRFRENDGTWAAASFRLAEIYKFHLKDPEKAEYIALEIARRMPRSEEGRHARTWIANWRNPGTPS